MLGLSPAHLLVIAVVAILLVRHKLPPLSWSSLRIQWPRWRFNTRDLIILTTLVAMVLGLVVYAMRTH